MLHQGQAPLRLHVELTSDSRAYARVVTLISGRAFVTRRASYGQTAPDRAWLHLDVEGRAHANLVERIRGLACVLSVTEEQPVDPAGDSTVFTVARTRCSTRVTGGHVLTDATVALAREGQKVLAAGEGCGPVEALASAFDRGVRQLCPQLMDVEVDGVDVSIRTPQQGLRADVEVLITATGAGERWTASAVAADLVHAAVLALTSLYTTVARGRAATDAPQRVREVQLSGA